MSADSDFDKKHTLVQQLLGAVDDGIATEDDLEQLYHDLQYIFECPFDDVIDQATKRGSSYIEYPQSRPNWG